MSFVGKNDNGSVIQHLTHDIRTYIKIRKNVHNLVLTCISETSYDKLNQMYVC